MAIVYKKDNEGLAWLEDGYEQKFISTKDMAVLIVNKKMHKRLHNETLQHEDVYSGDRQDPRHPHNNVIAYITIADLLESYNKEHGTEYYCP